MMHFKVCALFFYIDNVSSFLADSDLLEVAARLPV